MRFSDLEHPEGYRSNSNCGGYAFSYFVVSRFSSGESIYSKYSEQTFTSRLVFITIHVRLVGELFAVIRL